MEPSSGCRCNSCRDKKVKFTFRDIVKTSADMLFVEHIDMCQNINKPTHYTTEYDTNNLVVRRGQEFIIRVTFSRLLTQQDDFQLEFLIGPNPSHNKGSLVVVTFNTRHGGPWSGRVINMEGPSAVLGITPSPNAIVGKFRTYVAILVGGEMQRTKRDQSTDLYLLFNAWCPEDPVFLPNEEERREYVLNDMGIIYQGNASTVTPRSWMYGQFEKGILDACIYILDSSRMPIFNRGNVIKLVRKGSAMINSQDDNGVLVGNWSNDYSMGTRPTAWTGSVKILLKYANTGVPVCFAQCWVFAGVFNTFLRCFGIPSRVITNFSSAHDNTGNLKTDLIFNMDGTPDRRNTRDSIWNYHCWNEVNMVRYDLPPGYGGWQVVDATPQETSDGHYRCGPASVNAIKKGLLCHPFDAGFVLLRLVNSDVVFLKRDKYGTLTPFKVDTTHVGQALYTKAVGSNAPVNVTQTYKYPEGELKPCLLGADMKVEVAFQNHGNTPTSVEAHMEVSTIFYTGAIANHFKDQDFVVDIQPGGSECPYVPSNLIPSCSVPSNLVQSQSSPISSHPVTSLPVLPHPIHSIVAYPIPSHPVPSHPVLSCPTQSSPVQYISCSVASSPIPPVLSNPVQSVLSCSILSCPVLSSPVPSHPVRSRPVPSCSIPSRPVLSSLFVD
uniref:Transglutaminase-like domain-containing protein n=1 Tax=Salarias fasciatus TaxID=181472 RepID=A0A672FN80_SALFA